LKYNMMPIEL